MMSKVKNPSAFREWLDPNLPVLKDIDQEDRTSHTARIKVDAPIFTKITTHWEALLEQPFKGVTTDGNVRPNLFERRDDGIPIAEITAAGNRLLDSLDASQRTAIQFPLDARERRIWNNTHFYFHPLGLALEEAATPTIRERVWELFRAATSAPGYAKLQAATQINEFMGEVVGAPRVLTRHTYNFLLFGTPSESEPWGWLLYGHHLCVSFFVWGTQMVVSPVFLGAEPNVIDAGPHAGTTVCVPEQELAMEFVQGLPGGLRERMRLYDSMGADGKPKDLIFGWSHCGAFQDNRNVPLEGLCLADVDAERKEKVVAAVEQFVLYLPDAARKNRLEEFRKHIDETMFCWVGGDGEEDPFYYRIQSPVIICEFEHQPGVFLSNKEPKRFHIHTHVRTPNGGDYGYALLKE